MSSVLQILKLAGAVPPVSPQPAAPAPAPASSTPEKPAPPPKIQGSAFPSTPLPAATNGGFIANHPGLGGSGAIDTAAVEEQQKAMQEQNEQQVKGIQDQATQKVDGMKGQLDQTMKAQKNTQDLLAKNTKMQLDSWTDRLKTASSTTGPLFNPINPNTPTGGIPAPRVSIPGPLADDNPLKGPYDFVKKIVTNRLAANYAPKPLGMISDVNTRFGQKYLEPFATTSRWKAPTPSGPALLANLLGGLLSPGNADIGTRADSAVDQLRKATGDGSSAYG